MSPRIAIVERDRPYGVLAARQQAALGAHPAHVRREHQAEAEPAVRRRIVGMGLDRPSQGLDGGLVIGARHSPEMRLRLGHQLPCAEMLAASAASARMPSAASSRGSMAAATLRVISSCTAKMSPSSRS